MADGYAGVGHRRPRRSTACSRSTRVSRAGAHPGGRDGPRARGAARPARADAAPLPAVVRVLDARRLDRDARRRPLRDARHAHRRLRRVGPRGHAARRAGSRAGCPGRRRPVARPDAARLGGHARRRSPRRGCACSRGPRHRASARGALRRLRRRRRAPCGRSRSRACDPANCRLLDAREARNDAAPATAATRCSCSASSRPTIRVGTLARARARALRAITAGAWDGAVASGGGGERGRRAGARRSSARPTCATRSSRSACSPRRSRPRSPGIASPRSTSRCWRDRRGGAGEVCGAGTRHLPLHPRLPRRAGALLHGPRAGAPRARASRSGPRSSAAASDAMLRRGRHDHPPPRRRPRPPAVVRPPAARAVRRSRCARQRRQSTPPGCSTRAC